MRIFAKIRQVYDRLCERKEASAAGMRQERDSKVYDLDGIDELHQLEHLSEQAKRERRLAVERELQAVGPGWFTVTDLSDPVYSGPRREYVSDSFLPAATVTPLLRACPSPVNNSGKPSRFRPARRDPR